MTTHEKGLEKNPNPNSQTDSGLWALVSGFAIRHPDFVILKLDVEGFEVGRSLEYNCNNAESACGVGYSDRFCIVRVDVAWRGRFPSPHLARRAHGSGHDRDLGHEWVILANLLCLPMGFALLSRHFEKSLAMLLLPKYLPHDWKGGFVLLAAVWLSSSFLDNIAAALVGGAMGHQLFRGKVVGFAALIMSLGWHPLPKGA
jgi:hypothetical protein